MAFNGTLFSFGGYNFAGMIKAGSYEITPSARQDLDSYRDANGELHRTALEHTATSITFTIRFRTESEHETMMNAIRSNYINEYERDANCTYYDTETCSYKTGHFYLDANCSFSIYGTYEGTIKYQESEMNFVEY
ncbi:MAG: hypothetical protein LUI12_01730 [Clostridiales bacterium]|nr:hypothetical protein [Clostridiales bacterium]